MKYLFTMLLLAGCGQGNQIDPILQPYLTSFLQDGNIPYTNPINMAFGDLPSGNEDGLCQQGGLGAPSITIDPTAWAFYNETQRKVLVYHELGHCLLGRVHNNNLDSLGQPVSIMYYEATASAIGFTTNAGPFLQELFHP